MRLSDPPAPRSEVGQDRRSHGRYAVELDLHCKLVGSKEFLLGKTSDMSSNGVRFHAQRTFPIAAILELRIKWPTLPETLPLELVLEGRVIHSDQSGTAVQILRYGFGRRTMTAIREPSTGKAGAHIA